jgi:hypothetical protein
MEEERRRKKREMQEIECVRPSIALASPCAFNGGGVRACAPKGKFFRLSGAELGGVVPWWAG